MWDSGRAAALIWGWMAFAYIAPPDLVNEVLIAAATSVVVFVLLRRTIASEP